MSDKPKQDGNDNTIGERIAKHLDGAAAVNLSEPSPGDLERVVDAYRVLRYAYEDAQERIEHLEMVVESKQEHLDTMTKERDEARGLRQCNDAQMSSGEREVAIIVKDLEAKVILLATALGEALNYIEDPGMYWNDKDAQDRLSTLAWPKDSEEGSYGP